MSINGRVAILFVNESDENEDWVIDRIYSKESAPLPNNEPDSSMERRSTDLEAEAKSLQKTQEDDCDDRGVKEPPQDMDAANQDSRRDQTREDENTMST